MNKSERFRVDPVCVSGLDHFPRLKDNSLMHVPLTISTGQDPGEEATRTVSTLAETRRHLS